MRGECTPEQKADCPIRKHFSDTHHIYYPASNYRTLVEKEFRELPENKVQLCRNEHNERHATEEIPVKPSRDEMLQAISGLVLNNSIDI